jgi:hypothetical protein
VEHDLDLDLVALRGSAHHRSRVDAVDLDPREPPAGHVGLFQERCQAMRVVQTGGRDEHGQDEAERAGQNMALDAFDLLVRVDPACAFLRPGRDALRVHDPGRWLGILAEARPGGRGEVIARVTPDVLALLGDGVPQTEAAIVVALAGRHPKDDVRLTLMRLDVVGQLAMRGSRYTLPAPEVEPG